MHARKRAAEQRMWAAGQAFEARQEARQRAEREAREQAKRESFERDLQAYRDRVRRVVGEVTPHKVIRQTVEGTGFTIDNVLGRGQAYTLVALRWQALAAVYR